MNGKWVAVFVSIVFAAGGFLVPRPVSAFGHPFVEEPYITLWPAYSAGTRHVQFSMQHYFFKGYVDGANFRIGYPLSKRVRLYAGFFYHGQAESQVQMNEPEGKIYLTAFNQAEEKPLSLSLALGVSHPKYADYFAAIRGASAVDKNHFSAELPATRKLGEHVDVTIAPTWVYANGYYVDGITGGGRFSPFDRFAIVLEGSALFSNPYDYKNPWGYGLQYQIGPHTLTGFYTNTSGFTISNLMRGTQDHLLGFRFTY